MLYRAWQPRRIRTTPKNILRTMLVSSILTISYGWLHATDYVSPQVSAWLDVRGHMESTSVEDTPSAIFLTGGLNSVAAWHVVQALRRHAGHPVQLVLQSPGGDVGSSLAIVDAIAAQGQVATVVRSGGWCASACTTIFAAGHTRIAGADAGFLFHGGHATLHLLPGWMVRKLYASAQAKVDAQIAQADPQLEQHLRELGAADGDTSIVFVSQQLRTQPFLTQYIPGSVVLGLGPIRHRWIHHGHHWTEFF